MYRGDAPFEPRDQIVKRRLATILLNGCLEVWSYDRKSGLHRRPQTPLVERINPVTVRLGDIPSLGCMWSYRSDDYVIERHDRL